MRWSMRRPRHLAVHRASKAVAWLISALVLALAVAPAAHAVNLDEIPVRETGVVTMVNDGDTIRVLPDGQTAPISVRLIGINTPEVAGFQNKLHPFDYCGGPQAYRAMKAMLPVGTRVELRAEDPNSANRGRVERAVFALNPVTGQYDIDVAAEQARAGLATWFTLANEPALSADYRRLVDAAQQAQIGIWNPGTCGPIEQDGARLTLSIHFDAPGDDAANLNGEYVIIRNAGTSTVDISGWLLRDSSLTGWFTLPQGSVLTPGDFRVVHVGAGTPGRPDPHDLYINAGEALFPNPRAGAFIGDSSYLLDRNTAYRAWAQYPCLDDCASDPLIGRLVLSDVRRVPIGATVNARANAQTITVTNPTRTPQLLDDAYLRSGMSTFSFAPGTVLAPHASLIVHMGRGRATASDQFWGMPAPVLSQRGGMVELRSVRDAPISRFAWGDRRR